MDVSSTTVLPTARPGQRLYLGVYEEDGTAVYLRDDGGEIRLQGDFTWGYQGAGPRMLAYALLATEYDEQVARVMADRLMEQMIAQLPDWRYNPDTRPLGIEWELAGAQIQEWLARHAREYRVLAGHQGRAGITRRA